MAEIENFIDYFYAARKNALVFGADWEKGMYEAYRKPWGIYNSGLASYSQEFAEVSDESLFTFLEKRKESTGHAFMLDVMGQGSLTTDGPLDGEVAVTLVDLRRADEKERDDASNKMVVDGDVLRGKTWSRVRSYVEKNEHDMNGGFDLIVCRPKGGWGFVVPGAEFLDTDSEDADLYQYQYGPSIEWLLADRMFGLLSPTGGLLNMEMNGINEEWAKVLNELPGVESRAYDFSLSIIKNTMDIKHLPRIPIGTNV